MATSTLYPPAPPGVPADLARPGLHYRLQALRALLALLGILLFHLVLLACAFGLMVWAVWPSTSVPDAWQGQVFLIVVRVGVMVLGLMLAAFLLKGFFLRGESETSQYLEVTETEQPELFRFIRSLCDEIGCRMPGGVFLSFNVNAAVFYRTSILHLIVPPRKNLLIGLGLVNGINLVELKALLAHEFGHFSQRALRIDNYFGVAFQVIDNMVNGRDAWDNRVIRGFDIPLVSIVAVPIYALWELLRGMLSAAFRRLEVAHLSLRRQMEFNADLVAVSVAGSDAPVNLLFKADFSESCLQQCSRDLAFCAEQGLFTRDLFLHQRCAADWLRAVSKNSELGRLPNPSNSSDGVFRVDEKSTLSMWTDHPSHFDRERNAKRRYFQSPQDDRPAWALFQNQEFLREQLTRVYYRIGLNVEPKEPLSDPEAVQAFIDEEHAEATFPLQYQGAYDNRCLELPSYDELTYEIATMEQADPKQAAATLRGLYSPELNLWMTEHRRRRAELNELESYQAGVASIDRKHFDFRGRNHPMEDAWDILLEVRAELNEDQRYLARFDRNIFTLQRQLAEQLGRLEEFEQRYRSHFALQGHLAVAWDQERRTNQIQNYLQAGNLTWEQVGELEMRLEQVHERITDDLRHACLLPLPQSKHLNAGQSLASVLPHEPALPNIRSATSHADLNLTSLAAFHNHLALLVDKLSWVHQKSLVSLLAFQERLIGRWNALSETSQQN